MATRLEDALLAYCERYNKGLVTKAEFESSIATIVLTWYLNVLCIVKE